MSDDLQAKNWEAVDRFRNACERDADVVASFLGGSMASGKTHAESDVDVYVIVRIEDYERFLKRISEFLRLWGDLKDWSVVRNFEGLGFDIVPFEFFDGVRGELALGNEENFMATHGGPHKVLLDRTGILNGVTFPLQ